MTREEAIQEVNNVFEPAFANYIIIALTNGTTVSDKSLEQEPILDKIRAEIKALSPEPTAFDVVDGNPIKDAVWETIADVMKIIDKYIAESEE